MAILNNPEVLLSVKNLTKCFVGTTAVDDLTLDIRKKEIHAIIGENGAGKSTFCKLLTGLYQPDRGEVYLEGKQVHFRNPKEAMHAGIGMVYQERNLVGYLNGVRNICLGYEPVKGAFLNEKAMLDEAYRIKETLKVGVPVETPVEKLGAGEQQIIEIMRAFHNKPKVLILDEPTASLSLNEIKYFIDFIFQLRNNQDLSIIFISHKIEEVFQLADRITVLTDGRRILTTEKKCTDIETCVAAMIRKGQINPVSIKPSVTPDSKPILSIKSLKFDGNVHDLNIDAFPGEVVGLYGLVGSGRTEAMEALFGIRPTDNREFLFNDELINKENAKTMIGKGMILTPEKRANGAFYGLSLIENIGNLFLDKFSSRLGFMRYKQEATYSDDILKKNHVKHTQASQDIAGLSGGNIQKIIIGRAIEVENLKLLILDEPTMGLDLGAKHEIYLKIRDLVENQGKAVIFISSELEELLSVSDRIYTFFDGNVTNSFCRENFNKQEIIASVLKGVLNAS